jgi:hypothetical protein
MGQLARAARDEVLPLLVREAAARLSAKVTGDRYARDSDPLADCRLLIDFFFRDA